MPNFIANSVFKVEGRKYQPGEIVPHSLPEWEKLLEKGYIVWEGGAQAAREAAEKEAAEQAAKEAAEKETAEKETAEKETAEKETAEQAAKEAAEPNEKPVKGRKTKAACMQSHWGRIGYECGNEEKSIQRAGGRCDRYQY